MRRLASVFYIFFGLYHMRFMADIYPVFRCIRATANNQWYLVARVKCNVTRDKIISIILAHIYPVFRYAAYGLQIWPLC